MAALPRDNVWMSVSGTPGTGAVTLGSALSGYQSASSAGVQNGETNVWRFFDAGGAWEISSCVYTSSGTSLARTLIASSTGSLLSLTSAATCCIDANAAMLRLGVDRQCLFNSRNGWNFQLNTYRLNGVDNNGVANDTRITFSRASTGYAQSLEGVWTSFGSGVMRITDQGLLFESSSINNCLYSRDLTNAAWTKTNCSASKNLTGFEGTASAATTITASAANATVNQTVTQSGGNLSFFSAFVKRITGTGTVYITMDGTNFVDITSQLSTTAWTRVAIQSATSYLVNPTCGFKISTSGDAIGVDCCQTEPGFATPYYLQRPTSPIITTSAAVVRAADSFSAAGCWPGGGGFVYFETYQPSPLVTSDNPVLFQSPSGYFVALQNGSQVRYYDGTNSLYAGGTLPSAAGAKFSVALECTTGGSISIATQGGAVGTSSTPAYDQTAGGAFAIGGGSLGNNSSGPAYYVTRIGLMPGLLLSGPELLAITAPGA